MNRQNVVDELLSLGLQKIMSDKDDTIAFGLSIVSVASDLLHTLNDSDGIKSDFEIAKMELANPEEAEVCESC